MYLKEINSQEMGAWLAEILIILYTNNKVNPFMPSVACIQRSAKILILI